MDSRSVSARQLARLLGGPPEGRPYYATLARGLRGLVLDGRLPLRTRLPAERDLAGALGLSRTTVTSAYDMLRAEGYVESRQGSGSWTALPDGNPMARSDGPSYDDAVLDLGYVTQPAPALLAEAVPRAVDELPRYLPGPGYEPLGLDTLRRAIARRYTARGLPTIPEQVLVTSGAQSGLCLAIHAFLRPGDAVLVESPTYPHAPGALRKAQARLVPVGVNEGWDIDLITVGMRQSMVRMAYLIPDFQNPTGQLMDDRERAGLMAAARDAGAYVVVDESFAELAIDDVERPRPFAAHDTDGRVITVGSAAKVFWGGLRIGWIRATQALVRRLAEARATVDLASPVLDQLIVAHLLDRIDSVVAERRCTLSEQREVLVGALREQCPDWEFTVPPGGLSLWVRLPGRSSTALAVSAARNGLNVVPGTTFGVDGVLDHYVRVPYVLPPDCLREAVVRLARSYDEAGLPPLRSYV